MSQSNSIVIKKKSVDDINLTSLHQYLAWNPEYLQYFSQNAGQEAYKLLGYISMHTNGVITDIGTQFGSSALALSLNDKVSVETYDKFKHIPDNNQIPTIATKTNIRYKILSAQTILSKIAESTVVYLDINTQDGSEEIKIIHKLEELNFKGLLIIDDIKLNTVMENVWNSIPKHLKKIDVTEFGHWSGTGIVVYNPQHIDVSVE